MYSNDICLAYTVLDLPLVSVEVILGRDRTSVARQVQRWERHGWIQSLHRDVYQLAAIPHRAHIILIFYI